MLTYHVAVGNNLFLGFWTAESIDGFTQGQYMAVYGGLGTTGNYFGSTQTQYFSQALPRQFSPMS